MDRQRKKQAEQIQLELVKVRKALKILSDKMNWKEREPGTDISHATFLTTAAGKGTSERVNPLALSRDALKALDDARALLPRFLDEEEKRPVTLTANMKGEAGMLKPSQVRRPGR